MTRRPLDPETWRRVDALLDRALELAAHERAAFLDSECSGEPEIAAHVRELLAADEQAEDFLERPVEQVAGSLLGAGTDALPSGTTIPPWRLVREIGRGGMGAVYLADRADGQFEQRVALKVIRAGLRGGGFRERFLQERRILARLEHPRIARLLDGGFLDDDRPWFAMEYVDGVPITEYADRERLSVEERVDLFADVCDAVAHAQRHLVVHRDLKPSNVLVGTDRQPKLLDFGIAKIFAEPVGEPGALASSPTVLTRDGARLLTPEYAAPEQHRGEDVTTATDVWALGCILFELLCGQHPFAPQMDTPLELERAVLTGETRRLSSAVTQSAAGARRATTRSLRRRLRGDLANVVGRALARKPHDRYATAADLGEDLRNWRNGRPVTARAPSFRYLLTKAMARHRVAVGAGLAVLLALFAGLAATTWQARRAEREAERAVAVTAFLQSLFKETDPNRAQGTDVRASEILARGAERLDTELDGAPELRAELLQTVGTLYESLGDYDRAVTLQQKALNLRIARFGPEDPLVAESLGQLGAAYLASAQYDAADSALTRALDIQRKRRDSGGVTLATAVGNLAVVRNKLGRPAEAEALYREALAIDRAEFGDRSDQVSVDLSNLAVLLGDVGRLDEADALNREALAIRREIHPGDYTETATSLANLGSVLLLRGDLDAAESNLREAVDMRRRLFPDGHPHVAAALRNLGDVRRKGDDLAGAESLYTEALVMNRRFLGEDHFDVANGINDLATVAYFRRDLPAARDRFAEAITRFQRLLPEGHPTILTVRSNLATVNLELGDVGAAEREYRVSLAERIRALGETHPSVASDWRALGIVRARRGHWEDAADCYRKTLAIQEQAYGADSPDVADTKTFLARPLAELGRHEEAQALAREAVATLAKAHPEGHRLRVNADIELGHVLLLGGRFEEATPWLESGLAARREAFGEDDRMTAEAAAWVGECYVALGRSGEGRPLVERAVRVLLASRGPDDPVTKRAQRALAKAGPAR